MLEHLTGWEKLENCKIKAFSVISVPSVASMAVFRMNKKPVRGEIWLVDWSPGRGSEQKGLRPAVVIQTDEANLNERYPNVIVLTVSTKGRPVPFHISAQPSNKNNLKTESFIKCEQILTISKERLVTRIGLLEKEYLEKIKEAVKLVLELD